MLSGRWKAVRASRPWMHSPGSYRWFTHSHWSSQVPGLKSFTETSVIFGRGKLCWMLPVNWNGHSCIQADTDLFSCIEKQLQWWQNTCQIKHWFVHTFSLFSARLKPALHLCSSGVRRSESISSLKQQIVSCSAWQITGNDHIYPAAA